MRIAFCVAIAVSFLTAEGVAQRRTIPEMVMDQNGPLDLYTNANAPPISLTELVHSSDVIVRGTVTVARGDEAVFLLVRDNGKLFITEKYFGVFGIESNRVVPLTRTEWFAREHRGKPIDQLIAEIMKAARKR